MMRIAVVDGGYVDGWLSCDATLWVESAESVKFLFYVPYSNDARPKHIYVTDGAAGLKATLERGKINEITFNPSINYLRILTSHEEIRTESDNRSLGTLLSNDSFVEGAEEIVEYSSGMAGYNGKLWPPHYWIVHSYFDKTHYRKYIDGNPSPHDEVTHYLAFGWAEGFEPHPTFDSEFYLSQACLTNAEGMAPFAHYLSSGRFLGIPINDRAEGRRHRDLSGNREAWADEQFTEKAVALLRELGIDTQFLDESRLCRYIAKMFDPHQYRESKGLHPSVTDRELFLRYILFDYSNGMSPGGLFDEQFYTKQAAAKGLKSANLAPFRHWQTVGVDNRISPTPLFDPDEYLRLHADLKTYPYWLFEHWILHGLSEQRLFDSNLRIARNRKWDEHRSGGPTTGAEAFVRSFTRNPCGVDELLKMRAFRNSALFQDLIDRANVIDPNVGGVSAETLSLTPPLHDEDYAAFLDIVENLPERRFEAIVLMPFCKLGGADFVAAMLACALQAVGLSPIILRTDLSDWERPDWFPPDVPSLDISQKFSGFVAHSRERVLYEIIRHIAPKVVVNVNSRLAFETFEAFGSRLKLVTNLYCCYFCADRTPDGREAGYPIWHFASLLPHLAGALFDADYLRQILIYRHALGPELAERLHILHTPAMHPTPEVAIVDEQLRRRAQRQRPCILWAGRFDRQKRFDLLIAIAKLAPEIDFRCWGKPVLDAPPDLSAAPENLEINKPFTRFEELPLSDCDGWLYTSAWDGMPNIVVEIANMGMPLVASAVGGIPELVDDTTGWPIATDATAEDYVAALRALIADPDARRARAHALCARAGKIHTHEAFRNELKQALRTGRFNVEPCRAEAQP